MGWGQLGLGLDVRWESREPPDGQLGALTSRS